MRSGFGTRESFYSYGIKVNSSRQGNLKTLCPKCTPTRKNKKDRSLSVNTEIGVWLCHNCGWKGKLKVEIEEDHMANQTNQYARPDFNYSEHKESSKLYKWFLERGISREIVDRNKIVLGEIIGKDSKKSAIIKMPYFIDGEVINIKGRYIDEKRFALYPGAELCLYNVDSLKGSDWGVACEGETDCLAIQQAGIIPVVSVPNGAPSPQSREFQRHFLYLQRSEAILSGLKKIVLAVDNDPPGKNLEAELARRLGPERCYRVNWPDRIKDANEMLVTYGADKLRELIEKAVPIPIDGYITISDLEKDIDRLYEKGIEKGMDLGWRNLEDLFRLSTSRLIVITGSPGHGKTSWVLSMAVNVAKRYDWHFAICSPEMRPGRRIFIELIKRYVGKPFMDGPTPRMTSYELNDAKEWAYSRFGVIGPKQTPTLDHVLEVAKTFVYRNGTKAIIIDPFNQINHGDFGSKTETNYIGECLSKMVTFSERHDVAIIVVAHPTKLPRIPGSNRQPIPTLSDIVGSYNWRAMTDVGICVHRNPQKKDNLANIIVQKIRFEEDGIEGEAILKYDRITGRFSDVDPKAKDEVPESKQPISVTEYEEVEEIEQEYFWG